MTSQRGSAGALAVTITGSRSTDHRDRADYHEMFRAYLEPFAAPAARFYLGGASGIDTLVLNWLAEHTKVSITVAVPCTVADQPPDARDSITTARENGRLAELVELEQPSLGARAYHARNRWMVDRSALVIGFPHGDDPLSGTWFTLNYAADQGRARLIVPV